MPSKNQSVGSDSGEEEQHAIWEAKEILKEKRGKVYVSWVGVDHNGDPYPSTWEPRKHCNDALLAEWDAKQARKKEVDDRRKSGPGSDKPSSSRAAGTAPKGQKRKRESLPAPSAAGATSGGALKKIRRQATAGSTRRSSIATASEAAAPAAKAPTKALTKRKSMPALRVVSDSDSSDSVTFVAVNSGPSATSVGAAAGAKQKGKAREVSGDAPAASGSQPSGARASQPTAAAPSQPIASQAASSATDQAPTPSQPAASASSSQPAGTRPPTSPSSTQFRRINPAPVESTAASSSAPGPSAPKRAFKPIPPQASGAAPASSAAPPKRSAPATPTSLAGASSSQAPASQRTSVGSSQAQSGSRSAAPSLSVPAPSSSSSQPARTAMVLDDDEDDAMVEDALVAAGTSGASSSRPVAEQPAALKSTSLLESDAHRSALSSLASGSTRPRLSVPALKAASEDSEAEDPDDQEIIALPGPSGNMDDGIRTRKRSFTPAQQRYLEAALHNKALRAENGALREQLAALRDTRAQEALDKAELDQKKAELAKERAAHAATRAALRDAQGEVDSLSNDLDIHKARLRDATATETFLRDQYNTASEAARSRAVEANKSDADNQRLQKQLTHGVAQVREFYTAQIDTHDGAVDTLRAQVELLQKQHQRTGDDVRDKAALVPGLQREVAAMRRRIADLSDAVAEAQEDRDLAEAALERLEDERLARLPSQAGFAPETDSDDSDAEYRPPGSTPAPAAPTAYQVPVEPPSDDSSDEDSPLSQVVQRAGVAAPAEPALEIVDNVAQLNAASPSGNLDATLAPLPPLDTALSPSPSPALSLIEMPPFEPSGQYHAGAPSGPNGLVPLAGLHPSPNSAFGTQTSVPLALDDGQLFPEGTVSLQGLERAFGQE